MLGVEGDVDGDEKSLATDICVAAEVVGYFTIIGLERECCEWREEAGELEEDWARKAGLWTFETTNGNSWETSRTVLKRTAAEVE